MLENKMGKQPEGKKTITRKEGKKTITRKENKPQKDREPVKDKLLFLQGSKPAIIFDKAGKVVLARAEKGIFISESEITTLLLMEKGYKEVE